MSYSNVTFILQKPWISEVGVRMNALGSLGQEVYMLTLSYV